MSIIISMVGAGEQKKWGVQPECVCVCVCVCVRERERERERERPEDNPMRYR